MGNSPSSSTDPADILAEEKRECTYKVEARQQFHVDAWKFTFLGIMTGGLFSGILPDKVSLQKRAVPFFALGLIGIAGDAYVINNKCKRIVDIAYVELEREERGDVIPGANNEIPEPIRIKLH